MKITIPEWLRAQRQLTENPEWCEGFNHAQDIIRKELKNNPELYKNAGESNKFAKSMLFWNLLSTTDIANMLYNDTPKRSSMFINGFHSAKIAICDKAVKSNEG